MRIVRVLPHHGRHGLTEPLPGRPAERSLTRGDTLLTRVPWATAGGRLNPRVFSGDAARLRREAFSLEPLDPAAGGVVPVVFVGVPGVCTAWGRPLYRVCYVALGTTPEEAP